MVSKSADALGSAAIGSPEQTNAKSPKKVEHNDKEREFMSCTAIGTAVIRAMDSIRDAHPSASHILLNAGRRASGRPHRPDEGSAGRLYRL